VPVAARTSSMNSSSSGFHTWPVEPIATYVYGPGPVPVAARTSSTNSSSSGRFSSRPVEPSAAYRHAVATYGPGPWEVFDPRSSGMQAASSSEVAAAAAASPAGNAAGGDRCMPFSGTPVAASSVAVASLQTGGDA
jgi:hypothetical protein